MHVSFVCNANVGRSQVAQVYFNQLSSHESSGAGMAVGEINARLHLPSNKIQDVTVQRPADYISREFGADISERERRQLTPKMIDEADLVVIINEKEMWPDYVKERDKVVFWDIKDGAGRTNEATFDIFAKVRERVEELVKEIG